MATADDQRFLALSLANAYAMGLDVDVPDVDVIRRARRYYQFLSTEPRVLSRTTEPDPTAVTPPNTNGGTLNPPAGPA